MLDSITIEKLKRSQPYNVSVYNYIRLIDH